MRKGKNLPPSISSAVARPSHYIQGPFECGEIVDVLRPTWEAAGLDSHRVACAFEYLFRAGVKGNAENGFGEGVELFASGVVWGVVRVSPGGMSVSHKSQAMSRGKMGPFPHFPSSQTCATIPPCRACRPSSSVGASPVQNPLSSSPSPFSASPAKPNRKAPPMPPSKTPKTPKTPTKPSLLLPTLPDLISQIDSLTHQLSATLVELSLSQKPATQNPNPNGDLESFNAIDFLSFDDRVDFFRFILSEIAFSLSSINPKNL